MLTLAYLLATALVAADVACTEASHDWREVDAVLQVAINRSHNRRRPLLRVLLRPGQFAHGCPADRRHWRHLWAATRAMAGDLRVPAWLRDKSVRWFCSREAPNAWGEPQRERWTRRLEVIGSMRHLYWRRRH